MINSREKKNAEKVSLKLQNVESSKEILTKKNQEMNTLSENVTVIEEVKNAMTTNEDEEGNVLTKQAEKRSIGRREEYFFEALNRKR